MTKRAIANSSLFFRPIPPIMNPMHLRRFLPSSLLTLLLLASTFPAAAQPLADRLPDTTIVYLGWSPSASMQTTAAAKMLADERILAPWRKLFQEEILGIADSPEGERISDHVPALLLDAAQCEGCFALLEIKPVQGKARFNPQSVLMLDLGAKRKSFEEHFKPLQKRMKDRMGDRLKMMKLQNSWVFFKPDREGKPRITWGFVGDTFVMFFGDGAEDFIPKLLKGNLEKPLKSAPAFVDSVGKIPGESVFTTYLDPKATLVLARTMLTDHANVDLVGLLGQWDKLLEEFGFANIKAIAEKTTIEDKQFVTRSLVRFDGAAKGLLALAAAPAVDDAMLKVVPADAMVVAAARLDLAKTYEQIKTSVTNVVGDDAKQGFAQLEQAAEGFGLPVKDVLGPIGDQWVIYNAQSHGGFALTGWTLVGTIRDGDKLGKAVRTVRTLVTRGVGDERHGMKIRTINVDGVSIEFLEGGRFDMPFQVAWAIAGDKFVIALYPQLVEDAVRQITKPQKSILDNPAFIAARQRTGAGGPLVYLSGPDVVTNLYPIGLVFVQFATAFGGGFRDAEDGQHETAADLLPSMKRLLEFVGHDAVSIKQTPDGLLKTRTVANPLLSPLAWIDSPIVWLAIGIPSLTAADDAEDRTKSLNNLRQIAQGLLAYAADNKDNFPPDLATLVKAQHITDDMLKSPFGPAKNGKDIVYLHYTGLSTKTATPDTIVAYDAAAAELEDGAAVLYGDGRTDWLEPAAFKKAIEEAKKKAILHNAAP